MAEITIEIQGLGIIIIVATLSIMGIVSIVKFVIDYGLIYELKGFLEKGYRIPIFKTRKLRIEIGTIKSWFDKNSGVKEGVKNFYAWGRITYIVRRSKSGRTRIQYLAAFSMGKPIESMYKQSKKISDRNKKALESFKYETF